MRLYLKYTYSYVGLCILGFSGTCPRAVPSNTGMDLPKSIPLYTSTSHKESYLTLIACHRHFNNNFSNFFSFFFGVVSATMVALASMRFFHNTSLDNEFPQSNWLFCIQSFPCLVSFRCVLGVIGLDNAVQLYFIRVLFSNWLFCIQKFPCVVNSQCMLEVSVKVWTKKIL